MSGGESSSFPDGAQTGMVRDEPVSEPPAYPGAAPRVRSENRVIRDNIRATRGGLQWPQAPPDGVSDRDDPTTANSDPPDHSA